MTAEQVKRALAYAADNARATARRNAEAYIAWNPQDEERRKRDLDIEMLGIDNLYYKMLQQLQREV